MKSSRTYKLRLSDHGIALFLEQHARLARLLRDFIPYGETFAVAIALLEAQEPCEIAAELASAQCRRGLGDQVKFVGCTPDVAELTKRISDNLLMAGEANSAPKVVAIYSAALAAMRVADDLEILRAHRRFQRVRAPSLPAINNTPA